VKLLTDIRLLTWRRSLQLLRNPVWLFVSLTVPLLYLALFTPLLKDLPTAPGLGGDVLDEFEFVHWASPCNLFGASASPRKPAPSPRCGAKAQANRRLRCLIARQIPPEMQGSQAGNSGKTHIFPRNLQKPQ